MEDLEKKAREIACKAKETARQLAKPKPVLSELFGNVGRVEIYGRGKDGEKFIAELGPPTRITSQTLPKKHNPFREVLWQTRTWDNWAVQLIHYTDTGKVYLFMNHGPHYTAKLFSVNDASTLKNALRKAARRLEKVRNSDGPSETTRTSPKRPKGERNKPS